LLRQKEDELQIAEHAAQNFSQIKQKSSPRLHTKQKGNHFHSFLRFTKPFLFSKLYDNTVNKNSSDKNQSKRGNKK
jgi:hypothetical protein